MVEEHGAEMSSRDKKDARRVNAAFEFQDAASSSNRRRGGGPAGGGSGGGRERGPRDSQSQPQPAPRPTVGPDSRRSLFGAHMATEGNSNDSLPGPTRHQTPSPPPPSMDPVTAEYIPLFLFTRAYAADSDFGFPRRYTAIFARLRTLTAHPTNAVAGVKLALRDYTASQSAARDLISTVWNTLDRDLDVTASIINLVVDFLEDEEKKMDLLSAWNTFKIERRRELLPEEDDIVVVLRTSVGGGGGGGGADYARAANGRVVLSAHRATPPRQAQRAVWDRVARAAERGAPFPPLRTPHQPSQAQWQSHGGGGGTAPVPPHPIPIPTGPTPGGVRNNNKRGTRNTAWSASAASVSAGSASGGGGSGGGGGGNDNNNALTTPQSGKPPPAPPPLAPTLTNAAFPTLPSSAAPRARPVVVSARSTSQLQHIMGSAPPATSAWAPGKNAAVQDEAASAAEEEVAAEGKKKGKGKQKQKQTLFMFGSYPSAAGTG